MRSLLVYALAFAMAPLACARQSTQLSTLAAPLPAPDGVTTRITLAEYFVTGVSVADVQIQIREKGPKANGTHFAAVTRSSIKWKFDKEPHDGMCSLRNIRADVTERIEMPRYISTANSDAAVLSWWASHRKEISDHELGHVRIATNAGAEIVAQLRQLRAANCVVISSRADSVAKTIVARAKHAQSDYDKASDHGAVPNRGDST